MHINVLGFKSEINLLLLVYLCDEWKKLIALERYRNQMLLLTVWQNPEYRPTHTNCFPNWFRTINGTCPFLCLFINFCIFFQFFFLSLFRHMEWDKYFGFCHLKNTNIHTKIDQSYYWDSLQNFFFVSLFLSKQKVLMYTSYEYMNQIIWFFPLEICSFGSIWSKVKFINSFSFMRKCKKNWLLEIHKKKRLEKWWSD